MDCRGGHVSTPDVGGDTSFTSSSYDDDADLYAIDEEEDEDDDNDIDFDDDFDEDAPDGRIDERCSDDSTSKRVRWCPVLSSTLPYYFYDPITGEALEGRAARDQAKRDVLGDNWQVCRVARYLTSTTTFAFISAMVFASATRTHYNSLRTHDLCLDFLSPNRTHCGLIDCSHHSL